MDVKQCTRIRWPLVQSTENTIQRDNRQIKIWLFDFFFKPQGVWIIVWYPLTKCSSVDMQDGNFSAVEKSPHLPISSFFSNCHDLWFFGLMVSLPTPCPSMSSSFSQWSSSFGGYKSEFPCRWDTMNDKRFHGHLWRVTYPRELI